jgi:hypothetical protein
MRPETTSSYDVPCWLGALELSSGAISDLRMRIENGELPSKRNAQLHAGPGTGAACEVCGKSIEPAVLEYRFLGRVAEGARTLQFHCDCFWLWEMQVERLRGS